ncbi:hypothetical protein MKW98_027696 [Papaver atlanticum]|uniref:Uncharacterized protein n=1 Tax=Papaver atlanticum TaxID=357466 RepID=A0AAD4TDF2_9MAGN|nr:hypothetical protein MKW98_027696 [Papaver atlanticum]
MDGMEEDECEVVVKDLETKEVQSKDLPFVCGGPLSEGPQDNTKSDLCLVDSITLIRWRSIGSKHVLKTTTKS